MTAGAATLAVPDQEHGAALRAWGHAMSVERQHRRDCRRADTWREIYCRRCGQLESTTNRLAYALEDAREVRP